MSRRISPDEVQRLAQFYDLDRETTWALHQFARGHRVPAGLFVLLQKFGLTALARGEA